MAMDQELDIGELAEAAGVPVRTVRFYISSRLLPSPEGRGKATVYTDEHLDRLRLIRTLVEQRVPLSQIRETVGALSATEVHTVLERERRRSTSEAAARSHSAREYVSALLDRAQRPSAPPQTPAVHLSRAIAQPLVPTESTAWRRIELAPGLELHVRVDTETPDQTLVERIMQVADDQRRRTYGQER